MAKPDISVTLDKPKEFRDLRERFAKANRTLKGEPVQKVLRHFAVAAADFMREALHKGRGFPPLHPLTVHLKQHNRPLIETGAMEDAITAWQKGDRWVAGIPASATGSNGQSLADIANIHENGAHVPVTPAMRGFFARNGFPLKDSTRFLRIPKRPFRRPAEERLEKYVDDNLDTVMEAVLESLTEG